VDHPPPPPSGCQSPPLNTDFSDRGYFFVDSVNAILIGLTSDGENVVLTLSDIPDSGAIIGIGATAVSGNECDISVATFNNIDFFAASGTCLRLQNGEMLQVNNFIVAGNPLGVNPRGECDQLVFFKTESASLNEETKKMVKEFEASGRTRGLDTSQTHVLDLVKELKATSPQ